MQRGDYLRWLYRTGRPNAFARWQNRLSVRLTGRGLGPKRLVTLQVPGRRTGQMVSFPVVIADVDGKTYLVAMLGAGTNWVRNVEATGGYATLTRRSSQRVHLENVPVEERAPIIKRFLAVAPGARPHIRVDRHASLAQFHAVSADIPVFKITPA
jgi:hypothetical protein